MVISSCLLNLSFGLASQRSPSAPITMTIGQGRVLWIVSPVMFGVSA